VRKGSESWTLEVQIHPSDIRKRVRYLFLTRVQVTLWSVLLLVYLLFLALAAAVAPGVVGGMLNRQEYQVLMVERARRGERLQALVSRLEQLDTRAAGLTLRMNKIFLAYGLPDRQPAKARGRSAPLAAAPDSIYSGTIQQGNRLRARVRQELAVLDTFLREVRAFEAANPDRVRTTPSICPLRGSDFVLTSPFGRRRSPFTKEFEVHPGLDLAAPVGTPVHATAEGVVTFAGQYPMNRSAAWWRYGNLVIVENGDRFVTVFGHLQEVRVKPGTRVLRGDSLGTVGNTGWSTNPHLHYEIRRRAAAVEGGEARPVDPLIYVLDRRWQNEERLLVRAKSGPGLSQFEPLPPTTGRSQRRKR
jgi:murein DD-endopeptidase MepM/ murein hydrolase activator NlpD